MSDLDTTPSMSTFNAEPIEKTRHDCFGSSRYRSRDVPEALALGCDEIRALDPASREIVPKLYELDIAGWNLEIDHRAHNAFYMRLGSAAHVLTERERAIMKVINLITDQHDWQDKVCGEENVKAVTSMANVDDLLDEKNSLMVQEKSRFLSEYGFVTVCDVLWTAAKADELVSEDLTRDLQQAVSQLSVVIASAKDFQPGIDDQVENISDPSLYPLVYGVSSVVSSEAVPLRGCSAAIGKGETIPAIESSYHGEFTCGPGRNWWSCRWQWLPSDIKFGPDARTQIVSYINNLHPVDNETLYFTFARLVDLALPMWNTCIPRTGAEERSYRSGRRICSDGQKCWRPPQDRSRLECSECDSHYSDEATFREYRRESWEHERKLIQPHTIRYSQWDKAWSKQLDIRTKFAKSGLQVIFKLANIELTAEKPTFGSDGGELHRVGMQNEHIVATTIYFYDCKNVSENVLSLRQDFHPEDVLCGECDVLGDEETYEAPYEPCEHVGIKAILGVDYMGAANQELGGTKCRQGRMITFPITYRYEFGPLQLIDKAKAGHLKFLIMHLVDPWDRVLSTADVPPQQKDWWIQELLRTSSLPLPDELTLMVGDGVEDFPLGLEAAKIIREYLLCDMELAEELEDENMPHYDVFAGARASTRPHT